MAAKRRGRTPKPITIRGVSYPSQNEAARALGVSSGAICNAVRRGTLEYVGSGINVRFTPVRIRGHVYKSIAEAGRRLGVSPKNIGAALDRGTVDNVGSGRGSPRPIVIAGWCHLSREDAAEALGVIRPTVSMWARRARQQNGRYLHPRFGLVELPGDIAPAMSVV